MRLEETGILAKKTLRGNKLSSMQRVEEIAIAVVKQAKSNVVVSMQYLGI